MRGRKPIPAIVKLVTGNPGHRPIKETMCPDDGEPPCPDHLSGDAKAEWTRIVAELMKLPGLLSRIDMAALAMYCQTYSRWAYAERKIAEAQAAGKAGVIVSSPSGYPILSPWLSVANRAMEQCKALMVEFGMSPSSRSRIGPPSPQLGAPENGKNKKAGNRYFT